jgi:RNA polymerase sigma factor (TIGR02999 family)
MPGEITVLLQRWKDDPAASSADVQSKLVPLIYDHLRQVAHAYVSREFGGNRNEIEATGLVHELFLRLIEMKGVEWRDRGHFFAFAARLMRNILVDEARKRGAAKRGGHDRVPLAADLAWVDAAGEEMLDVHAAFEDLSKSMPEVAATVELRVFLGCTSGETASLMEISKATVDRQMRFARAWLYDRLRGSQSSQEAL